MARAQIVLRVEQCFDHLSISRFSYFAQDSRKALTASETSFWAMNKRSLTFIGVCERRKEAHVQRRMRVIQEV